MAISMVRKPSETPNITNIDDIIPFRYAYGNQNGYVIGRGAEVSHTVNGNQFTINSGRLVVQGVESDIDANGVTLTIDSVSETRYYVVYYEINLATNTANIKLSNYSTTGYPTIDAGDDLTANSNGTARLPLYRFTAKSGAISGVEKVVKAIEYSGSALVGYDISKGTVEERLEKLGFKQGSITLNSGFTATNNIILRQGNYCILNFRFQLTSSQIQNLIFNGNSITVGTLGEEFKPMTAISNYVYVSTLTWNFTLGGNSIKINNVNVCVGFNILANGTVELRSLGIINMSNASQPNISTPYVSVQVGYEAKPL